MSGSKTSGPAGSTTTSVAPWSVQQPYLEGGFQAAQKLFNDTPPQYFPDATYAGQNPLQTDAIRNLTDSHLDNHLGLDISSATKAIAGGDYLRDNPAISTFGSLAAGGDPATRYLGDYLSGANLKAGNPNIDALSSSIMARVQPALTSQFIAGGALNSPEAARAISSGMTSALAQPLFQQYQQEEQNQLAAAQQLAGTQLQAGAGQSNAFESAIGDMVKGIAVAPGSQQMLFQPGQIALGAGTTQQQLDQQSINDAVNRWNYGQTSPYQALNQYMSSVGGTGYGSSSTTPFFGNSSSTNLLGGALGGASLGSMLFPAAAGATSYGALGGAGIGSLFALLSDRRAKDDITKVGELDNGLTVYSYRYKGEPEGMRHIGLMADEVEKEHPEAVETLPGYFGHLAGLKAVDYAKAVV